MHCQTGTCLRTSRKGKCAYEIMTQSCAVWMVDQYSRDGEQGQSVIAYSQLYRDLLCVLEQASLRQECNFQCPKGHSSKAFPHQVNTFSPSVQIFFTSDKYLADSCLLVQQPCYPCYRAHRRKGWRKTMSMSSPFHPGEHLAALDVERYAWAPLLHHGEGNLWRFIPIYNAQSKCIQFICAVHVYYFYSLSSACESVKHAEIYVGGTLCAEIWGTCGLVCSNTSEALSCLGIMPSMTPQQALVLDHCFGKAPVIWPV